MNDLSPYNLLKSQWYSASQSLKTKAVGPKDDAFKHTARAEMNIWQDK